MATAKTTYKGAAAALITQLLEAHHCKQAAKDHARNICEESKTLSLYWHKAKIQEADNEQAQQVKTALQVYLGAVLAVKDALETAKLALDAAESNVGERRTEQEQVLSRQHELVRQLTSALDAAEAAHKVCLCQNSPCILLEIPNSKPVSYPQPSFISQAAISALFGSHL